MKNRKLRLFVYSGMQAAALFLSVHYPQVWAQTTEANNSSAQRPSCANLPCSMSDEQIAELVGSSKVRTTEKVLSLTPEAYKCFDGNHCDRALRVLNQAIVLYEGDASSDKNGREYGCFRNIRARLAKCQRKNEGTELLWRLVKARMECGFSDPYKEYSFFHQSPPLLKADEELLEFPINSSEVDACTQVFEQFCNVAKETGNTANIIFALIRKSQLFRRQGLTEDWVQTLEQIEAWRAKSNSSKVISTVCLILPEGMSIWLSSIRQSRSGTQR
jgi:hypothetical protein